ncbi:MULTISPECIES: hypothetical protein [unclassified Campylobacter]|uniref:hypothetical protein n=1 Tax=unclassified Campylobacter TaxID=2593542 RepID=UPI0022E9C80A|nr:MULTISPECIES: hypothetical protein [unclassified Campylobacter]MDA3062242.1 hypothetical protein [Campylobacter sp. JMF_14 EL1]MDA3073639.1 hypothetical protein [Campylobacter sp. JMF_10 EL2]
MPLPIIILAPIPILLYGVKKCCDAYRDNKTANSVNNRANEIIEDAKELIDTHRKASGKALENLGEKKLFILDNVVKSLIDTIEKIEFKDSIGLQELSKFKIDKSEFVELKEMSGFASSILGGTVAGTAGGALTAFGAYSAAGWLATASTGTAISTLSGVAATNATLAFFGGGSLAAGGLGVAGGTAVLGGLVAAPALAVIGLIASSKASALKDEAYANLDKARKYERELKTASVACDGIRRRADMFYRFFLRLESLAMPINYELSKIVEKYKNPDTGKADPTKFDEKERKIFGASISVIKTIKTLLDTPLLTESGELTEQSELVATQIDEQVNLAEKQVANEL